VAILPFFKGNAFFGPLPFAFFAFFKKYKNFPCWAKKV
jgi:hypothetical protein